MHKTFLSVLPFLYLPLLPFPSLILPSFSPLQQFFFWQRVTSSLCPFGDSPFSNSLQPPPTSLHPAVTLSVPPYPTERPLSYCQFFSHWHEAWLKLSIISFRLTWIHFINVLDSPCFMKQNALNGIFSWWLRVTSMNTYYCSVLYSYKNQWSI